MNIYDLLYEENSRVSCGFRWAVFDNIEGWTVYSREPYQKHTRTIIETEDEDEAMRYLKGPEE